jgi:hypothetical protein
MNAEGRLQAYGSCRVVMKLPEGMGVVSLAKRLSTLIITITTKNTIPPLPLSVYRVRRGSSSSQRRQKNAPTCPTLTCINSVGGRKPPIVHLQDVTFSRQTLYRVRCFAESWAKLSSNMQHLPGTTNISPALPRRVLRLSSTCRMRRLEANSSDGIGQSLNIRRLDVSLASTSTEPLLLPP